MQTYKFIYIGIILSIAGCSTPKLEQENLRPSFQASNITKKVFTNNIYVWNSKGSKFELAVLNAVKERNMYAQDLSSSRYMLTIKVIEERVPKAGLTMEGSITVEYELVDKNYALGSPQYLIFREIFTSHESAGITDEAYGPARVVLIVQNYVKSNIKSLLTKLDEVSKTLNDQSIFSQNEEKIKQRNLERLRELFSKYDIYSNTPFFVTYPYKDNGNYTIQSLTQYSTVYLLTRLSNASQSELEVFKKNYYSLLDSYLKSKVDTLINEKIKQNLNSKNQTNEITPKSNGAISGGLPSLLKITK